MNGKFIINSFFTMIVIFSQSAFAQQVCADFDTAIDSSLKSIALEKARGIGDDSAPRETNRRVRISNELAMIQMNLSLMAQNKCAPLRSPINDSGYMSNAMECITARMQDQTSPPACEFKEWKKKF